MNFLFVFFLVLMNCTRYEITSNNYNDIKMLIPKPDEVDLYDEISNKPGFLCLFEVNENEYGKEIKIIKLNNINSETENNIFPLIFCEISNIKYLILSGLTLSKLPNQFEKLKELEFLDLSVNKFKEFPQVLFSLEKLKTLYLGFNKFDMIPSEIIRMSSLETLNIQDFHCLISISQNLFKLKNLTELNLSHNFLLFGTGDSISCMTYSDDYHSAEKKSRIENNNDYTNFVSYKS
ncbi:Leucine rich repeat protein, partial [Spraguea lophii 42_110]